MSPADCAPGALTGARHAGLCYRVAICPEHAEPRLIVAKRKLDNRRLLNLSQK